MPPLKGRPLRRCAHALCIFWLGVGTDAGYAQIATQNNPHGRIANACGDCHTTKSWSPLRLDVKFKHENTGFALEGRHALAACKECHASLLFTGASRNCRSCHIDAHDGTLGVDCARCHTFQSWQDVSRVTTLHQTTRFPLHGRHQHVGCDDCHRMQNESQFINMPLNCYACHQKDYEQTTDPNHAASNFSHDCLTCHTSSAWTPGTFDHGMYFPIYTGAHKQEKWQTCTAFCHVVPSNYKVFECITCHAHDKTKMDEKHLNRVWDYQYNSAACYNCHPDGKE